MRIVISLLLIIVSFFGTIFFRYYHGTLISYPFLWLILFILLGVFGLWLAWSSVNRETETIETSHVFEIENFKINAEKVELNFDHCEFKNGSYSHQVKDKNITSIKWIAPSSIGSLADTTVTETVHQSYLIYNDPTRGTIEKYMSQPFSFDLTTLRFYVLNKNIILYVDRFDRSKYYFELKK